MNLCPSLKTWFPCCGLQLPLKHRFQLKLKLKKLLHCREFITRRSCIAGTSGSRGLTAPTVQNCIFKQQSLRICWKVTPISPLGHNQESCASLSVWEFLLLQTGPESWIMHERSRLCRETSQSELQPSVRQLWKINAIDEA